MKWFTENSIKQLKIFAVASGGPTALLVVAAVGNNLVNKGVLSNKLFITGMTVLLISFIVALVVYAADKNKN